MENFSEIVWNRWMSLAEWSFFLSSCCSSYSWSYLGVLHGYLQMGIGM